MATAIVPQDWREEIPLFQEGYHRELLKQVNQMRATTTIYPPPELVFNALQLTPFDEVKVVIVGQDPYHGRGQAHGLAFSVPEGVRTPPSLRNVFKEIARDVYAGERDPREFSADLTRWAEQGVLLLNASLTVEAGQAGSHSSLGWQELTDQIIAQLSAKRDHLVFMLWGKFAQAKKPLIDTDRHLVLETSHPSPYSAHLGFEGSGHFSQANAYLATHNREPVTW